MQSISSFTIITYILSTLAYVSKQACIIQQDNVCIKCLLGTHIYRGMCFNDIPNCLTYDNGFDCSSCKSGYDLDNSTDLDRKCIDFKNEQGPAGIPLLGFIQFTQDEYFGQALKQLDQIIREKQQNANILFGFKATKKDRTYFRLIYEVMNGYLTIVYILAEPYQNSILLKRDLTVVVNLSLGKKTQKSIDFSKDPNRKILQDILNDKFKYSNSLMVLQAFKQIDPTKNIQSYNLYVLDSDFGVRAVHITPPLTCQSSRPTSNTTNTIKPSFFLFLHQFSKQIQTFVNKIKSFSILGNNSTQAVMTQLTKQIFQNQTTLYNITFSYKANGQKHFIFITFIMTTNSQPQNQTFVIKSNKKQPDQLFLINSYNFNLISKCSQPSNKSVQNLILKQQISNRSEQITKLLQKTLLCSLPSSTTQSISFKQKQLIRFAIGSNQTNKIYQTIYIILQQFNTQYLTITFNTNQKDIINILQYYLILKSQQKQIYYDDFQFNIKKSKLIKNQQLQLQAYTKQYNVSLDQLRLFKTTVFNFTIQDNGQLVNHTYIIYKYQYIQPLSYQYVEFRFENTTKQLLYKPIIFIPIQRFITIQQSINNSVYNSSYYLVNNLIFQLQNITTFQLKRVQKSLDRNVIFRAIFNAQIPQLGLKQLVYEFFIDDPKAKPILINISDIINNNNEQPLLPQPEPCSPLPDCDSINQLISLQQFSRNLTLNRLQLLISSQLIPSLIQKNFIYIRRKKPSQYPNSIDNSSKLRLKVYQLLYATINRKQSLKVILAIDQRDLQAYIVQLDDQSGIGVDLLNFSQKIYGPFNKRTLIEQVDIIQFTNNSIQQKIPIVKQLNETSDIQKKLTLQEQLFISFTKSSIFEKGMIVKSQQNKLTVETAQGLIYTITKDKLPQITTKIKSQKLKNLRQDLLKQIIKNVTGQQNIINIKIVQSHQYFLQLYSQYTVKYNLINSDKSINPQPIQLTFEIDSRSIPTVTNMVNKPQIQGQNLPSNIRTASINAQRPLITLSDTESFDNKILTKQMPALQPSRQIKSPQSLKNIITMSPILSNIIPSTPMLTSSQPSLNAQVKPKLTRTIQSSYLQKSSTKDQIAKQIQIIPLQYRTKNGILMSPIQQYIQFKQLPQPPEASILAFIDKIYGKNATILLQRKFVYPDYLYIMLIIKHNKFGKQTIFANINNPDKKYIFNIVYDNEGFQKQGKTLKQIIDSGDSLIMIIHQNINNWLFKAIQVFLPKQISSIPEFLKFQMIYWRYKKFSINLQQMDLVLQNTYYTFFITSFFIQKQTLKVGHFQAVPTGFNTTQKKQVISNKQPLQIIIESDEFRAAQKQLIDHYGFYLGQKIIISLKMEDIIQIKSYTIKYLVNSNNIFEARLTYNTATKQTKILSLSPLWTNKSYDVPANCRFMPQNMNKCFKCFNEFELNTQGFCIKKTLECDIRISTGACIKCNIGYLWVKNQTKCI